MQQAHQQQHQGSSTPPPSPSPSPSPSSNEDDDEEEDDEPAVNPNRRQSYKATPYKATPNFLSATPSTLELDDDDLPQGFSPSPPRRPPQVTRVI